MTAIYTIGHSTRSLEQFVALLQAHEVDHLVDVRRYPGSKRYPHFSRESLSARLPEHGIEYLWLEGLGGRRKSLPDTEHVAWRVKSFAAYADYMQTAEFQEAAEELLSVVGGGSCVAIMCAEARPEQCHRRLVADWLTIRDHEVRHISSRQKARVHQLPPFARVTEEGELVYDLEESTN